MNSKNQKFVQIMALVLAILMIGGAATAILYSIL